MAFSIGKAQMLRTPAQKSSFTSRLTVSRAHSPAAKLGRNCRLIVLAENVLIVNTKGGGHAFIGLFLAEQLLAARHSVTILNDGEEEKLSKKAPFSQYSKLANKGLQVVYGDPTNPRSYPAGSFDVVYDNNGKDLDTCKTLIDAYKVRIHC
eukprot:jgi/Botrbrau1/10754/Bobra.180_2s0019.1